MATTPLLSRPVLVVEQKTKLFELNNEYGIFDESGERVGSITQVGQSILTLLARLGTDLDVALPVKLELREPDGSITMVMHKPWFRMTVDVSGSDGAPVGSIRKQIRVGKARFALTDAGGRELGEVRAQNWRAKDFAITDLNGQKVAQVNKKFSGIARELFTDADTYVVQLETSAQEPLRSLGLAAALAVDLVMKQKDAG